jgi:BMFP domain-containing protein YqiC
MQPSQFLKDLTERLCNALPPQLNTLKKDWEKSVHGILTSAFQKFDVVSREEFDTQTKVLARTRKKVEALEAELAELEKMLESHNGK